MKKNIAFLIFLSVFCALFVAVSCSRFPDGGLARKRGAENSSGEIDSDGQQLWEPTERRVCVLFGYGYNATEEVSAIMQTLSQKFGASSEGGLIMPIVFPDDFRRDTRAVPSDFYELLSECKENYTLSGIILLGAPERTNQALSRLQDTYEDGQPFAVFSFFSQDDVAGMEATADIVIDKAQVHGEEEMLEAEYAQDIETDIAELLLTAVQFVLDSGGSLPKDSSLLDYVQDMMGQHEVSHYIDSGTGLRAINHFVFD